MRLTFLLGLAVLAVGGCAESAKSGKPESGDRSADKSAAKVADVPQEPVVPSAATAPDSDTDIVADDAPLNAEALLASTLENAKADDKRVMVHLGAPW